MKHKSFMDIERYKTSFNEGFVKGDHIIIQEKVDGANCAIRYDAEADSIVAQSREHILTPTDDMRGFYEWAQNLPKDQVKSVLGDNLVLFGEWLTPHAVVYPTDCYNKAYFYDVYDLVAKGYLPQHKVKEIIERLNLTYVPTFYDGEFTSWKDLDQYVGKTALGGEVGEGIVVKNQTRLNSNSTFYTKILSSKYSEVKKAAQKIINDEKAKELANSRVMAETIVTRVRVEKMLYKFVDEGLLPEDWGAKEFPVIAKNISKRVYADCVKEEPETVNQIDKFGKVASAIALDLVKQIISERAC